MNPHLAEVMAKARLEKRAGLLIEGLAGRAQYVMHNRRRCSWPTAGCAALKFFLFAIFAFAFMLGGAAVTLALQQ
jgi:hypothetical protein